MISELRAAGFTLIEFMIVIVVIGFLAVLILPAVEPARTSARVVKAGAFQATLANAVEAYHIDMGFYPPDVNRGWDPGLVRSMPWSPDAEAGDPPTGGYSSAGTNCNHCPSNWQSIVQARWQGPYLQIWPRFTPWQGKYDYNYWDTTKQRGSCSVTPGIYVGVQGDYDNNNTIPQNAEENMISKSFDAEQCLNGESQMLLWRLNN